jgi:hypothetical protein
MDKHRGDHLKISHAFGVDDIASLVPSLRQIVFILADSTPREVSGLPVE